MTLCVGVLAVQGAVSEHMEAVHRAAAVRGLDVAAVEVRDRTDLDAVHGIIIPGGESTTISRLLRSGGLQEPIIDRAGHDLAVFGTCAGMVLLASRATHDVEDKDVHLLGLLEAEVDRNAFGRQRESFEAIVDVDGIGPMPAVFIRAPVLTDVWGDTQVLCEFKGRCVVAAAELVLATAFHPELTPDTRLHEQFLAMVVEAASRDPDHHSEGT